MESKFIPTGFAAMSLSGESTPLDPYNAKPSNPQVQMLQETSKTEEGVMEENHELSPVVAYVKGRFERSKNVRREDEARWLMAYRNFRGIYGPDVQFTAKEKSRAFIKITKTKVLASYGKLIAIMFANKKFPIGVEETIVPEGIAKSVYFDSKEDQAEKGAGPANQLPGSIARKDVFKDINDKLGPYKQTLSRLPEDVKIREGAGKTPTSQTFEPAKEAARKMDDMIQDQLDEMEAGKHLRLFLHELCLYGSGVWQGPFAKDKEYPRWSDNGTYSPVIKTVPDGGAISIWNAYPDADARMMEDCEYWVTRHRMTKSQVRALKKRPYFREQSVNIAVDQGPNYIPEYWEHMITDNDQRTNDSIERYEVLEYWGLVDREFAEMYDIDIPSSLKDVDDIQVNIWICNNQVLRFVLNPFTPARIPFYVCPYEVNPSSIFGVGVAENMADTQLIMNGFMRLAIDNAVLSSNLVFEVDETNLVPGQDLEMYPGKVIRRQSGAPGQALFATKFPNVTQECLMMFDKARQLSDEATGMPSYAHGVSGIMSTGRTASGMNMLMEAADENLKSVVRNIDDYLLIPFGEGLYSFNMQFNFDKDIKGDLTVIARGTESLTRNEIRNQKLLQFLQITAGELDAPFVKRDYILRELAISFDLDPEKAINDPREAGIQAENLRKLKEQMGTAGQPIEGAPNAPTGAMDPTNTGGGQVTPGAPTPPGAEGFKGSPQASGEAATVNTGTVQ